MITGRLQSARRRLWPRRSDTSVLLWRLDRSWSSGDRATDECRCGSRTSFARSASPYLSTPPGSQGNQSSQCGTATRHSHTDASGRMGLARWHVALLGADRPQSHGSYKLLARASRKSWPCPSGHTTCLEPLLTNYSDSIARFAPINETRPGRLNNTTTTQAMEAAAATSPLKRKAKTQDHSLRVRRNKLFPLFGLAR